MMGIIIIPASMIEVQKSFKDLPYSTKPQNKVELSKQISISVNNSASPLFYKIPKIRKFNSLEVMGRVEIEKDIEIGKDTYLQIGVIYAGDYLPGSFMKAILPKWLIHALTIGGETGIGEISYLEISKVGQRLNKKDSIRGIPVSYKTLTYLDKDSHFKGLVKLKGKDVLGLWMRIEGAESSAKFKTIIESLKLN